MHQYTISQRVIESGLGAAVLLLFSGCVAWTTVSGIKPVYPKEGILVSKVDSLQPEFKWKGGGEAKEFDLAIWDSIKIQGLPKPSKIIYEKTGLKEFTHKPEFVLEPGTFYYWSVRETGSAKWSTAKHELTAFVPPSPLRGSTNMVAGPFEALTVSDEDLFLFYTPKTSELERKP
jgi:hypothetical protein